MKDRLDPISAKPWVKFDSDTRADFIACRLSEHAKIAIYDYGKAFLASVRVEAEEAELNAHLDAARQRVLDELLPAVGARAVRDTAPPDIGADELRLEL